MLEVSQVLVELVDGTLLFYPMDGVLCMVPFLYGLGFISRMT